MSRPSITVDGLEFDLSNLCFRDEEQSESSSHCRYSPSSDSRRSSDLSSMSYPAIPEIPQLDVEDVFSKEEGSFSSSSNGDYYDYPPELQDEAEDDDDEPEFYDEDEPEEFYDEEDGVEEEPLVDEFGRQLIEVMPNEFLPLRDGKETWTSFLVGRVTDVTCLACQTELFVVEDALMVQCSKCRMISPVEDPVEAEDGEGGGLGLGMTYDEAYQHLAATSQQEDKNKLLEDGLSSSLHNSLHGSLHNSLHHQESFILHSRAA